MAAPPSQQLWSSIAKDKNYTGGSRTFATTTEQTQQQQQPSTPNPNSNSKPTTTSSSKKPSQEKVYILTLQTDAAHHARLTALRTKYFPPHLNKLEAHLTLFHALPESKLETEILPAIERVAASTGKFEVVAERVFRMKKGVGIGVSEGRGGREARKIRGALLGGWKGKDGRGEGWLTEQDSQEGFRAHYTVMNKVEDEEVVGRVLGAVERGLRGGDRGEAVGLGLWRYERGWWKWMRGFEFRDGEGEGSA